MKLTLQRLLILFAIILLSVAFGFGFDAAATAIDKKNHPRPQNLEQAVGGNAQEFGVPEPILWATIKVQSDFSSNTLSDTGAVGLMQITPEEYDMICREILGEDPLDAGILYDPETNLRVGAAYLSRLYQRYGVWDTVYAAYHAGTDQVDAWLRDPTCVNNLGMLENIPQKETQSYVKRMKKAVSTYSKLYYES